MKSARMILLVAVALLVVAGSASAAVTATITGPAATNAILKVSIVDVSDAVGTPDGYTTFDIQVTATGTQWVNAHLGAVGTGTALTTGTLWNATAKDKYYPQTAYWEGGSYTALIYDTFINTWDPTSTGYDRFGIPVVAATSLLTSKIDADWGTNDPVTIEGAFTIARLTVSDDTTGVIPGKVWDNQYFTGGNYETFNVVFTPEPMTMALLAVGGISMMIRRRRNA
jgi:streptogramin lyase